MNLKNSHKKAVFLPEWAEQDAILLAWPNADTDWKDNLEEVCDCYKRIVKAILPYEDVVILSHDHDCVKDLMSQDNKHDVHFIDIPYNDTWARDFGPIAVQGDDGMELLDFTFNAWGMKFAANHDNMINRRLSAHSVFAAPLHSCKHLVLEGGSIETDGNGNLMTTASCLLAPNRNDNMDKSQIEDALTASLGVSKILWLNYGHLEGDDTDGHIDTLARFAPEGVILYTACRDAVDVHFYDLQEMEQEIMQLRDVDGKPYTLVSLPLPDPVYDDEGNRLPATYANFLICNKAVLVPTYGQPHNDALAIEKIKTVFPGYEVVGVDCSPLIKQHGSLHCATMQLPKGFLNYENRNYTTE